MNKTYNILIIFMMFISSMAAPLSADEAASAEYLNSGKVPCRYPPVGSSPGGRHTIPLRTGRHSARHHEPRPADWKERPGRQWKI